MEYHQNFGLKTQFYDPIFIHSLTCSKNDSFFAFKVSSFDNNYYFGPHEFFIFFLSLCINFWNIIAVHALVALNGLWRRNSQRKWFRFVADQIEKTKILSKKSLLTTKGYNLGLWNSLKVFPDVKELEQKSLSFVCDFSLDNFPIEFLWNFFSINRSTFISCYFSNAQMHRQLNLISLRRNMWASVECRGNSKSITRVEEITPAFFIERLI